MCASAMSIHKQSTVSGNGRARMPCFKKSSLSVQHGAIIHAPRRRIFGICQDGFENLFRDSLICLLYKSFHHAPITSNP